jgi:aconitate hydratase
MSTPLPFQSLLKTIGGTEHPITFISLERAEALGFCAASRLPLTLKILLESALRHAEDLDSLDLKGLVDRPRRGRLEFRPMRLLLQDFTGVPLMTDMASLRDVVANRGRDPKRVNPIIPVDFVCDHALIAVHGGRPDAISLNEKFEIEHNRERFEFLKWCSGAFSNVRLIPPGSGIMHQLNLEWLSTVVALEKVDGATLARPDTLLGTDSHTPMVGGLGVLGWGVGGIEAQAAMLGHSTLLATPRVVGLRLSGALPTGTTATDLVLHVAAVLRRHNVVNAFVEVFGDAVGELPIETRATIANMAPEYGATSVYFPLDQKTLNYLRLTGRNEELISRVETYAKAQDLWGSVESGKGEQIFDSVIEFDLSKVEPSLAGPKRPEQQTPLSKVRQSFQKAFETKPVENPRTAATLRSGDVVIAAITSCTNTANPNVMMGAGLLARNALRRGLKVKPWVKTSLAPGSRVVGDYLAATGLQSHLDGLGFQIIGYGCTTCNGNSGPLQKEIESQITLGDVTPVAVLSGNRNFAGRIHPLVPAAYLASPALVIAFAIAGTVLIDLTREPLGIGLNGEPVTLSDIWPSDTEITSLVSHVSSDSYRKAYYPPPRGHGSWSTIAQADGKQFPWAPDSTFITPSPIDRSEQLENAQDVIDGMRALAILGDNITTDTLSPNGAIQNGTPAARFLTERGVNAKDFGNYAARRGCHEIALRGMFANPHIENEMIPGTRGPYTFLMPENQQTTIFNAGMTYVERRTPTIVIAGKAYGSGSSRDWAAKGLRYLGVRAVLAESFERIHRANLVGVGIVPLTFVPTSDRKSLGLTGREQYRLRGLSKGMSPNGKVDLDIIREDGRIESTQAAVLLEADNEVRILRAGGLLPVLLQEFAMAS